jgi:FAD/FMN-containing dehydrogenase
VLVESQGSDRQRDGDRFSAALEAAFEQGLIVDAAVAQSEADALGFWALRDDVEQVLHGGLPIGFDISLPIAEMQRCVQRIADDLATEIGSGHQLLVFGHLGDGNLHVVVQVPAAAFVEAKPRIEALVYGRLAGCSGSVSAEHGIGLEKKSWLANSRNAAELALMRQLKRTLDPRSILNPGKLFDV